MAQISFHSKVYSENGIDCCDLTVVYDTSETFDFIKEDFDLKRILKMAQECARFMVSD